MVKNGRWSARVPSSYTGTTPGMLELAADLGLLHEPVDQVGPVAVLVQQDLQRQVAAQVRVAASEHRSHPAAGDLAQHLIPPGRAIDQALVLRRAVVRLGPRFGRPPA